MRQIDLRSDTLTKPTTEMLESILCAPVGDDGRASGRKGEDPTVAETEIMAAKLFGKEDALFVPSGTLGNTLCGCTHCPREAGVVIAENMHAYRAEESLFSPEYFGRKAVLVPQSEGMYHMDPLHAALKSGRVRLVWLENSYNFEGGRALPREDIKRVADLCHQYDVPIHLDGARIFNAAAALHISVKELTQDVDSIMFCVSKGLSAPIGSFVVGSYAFIDRARVIRKKLGGQLRQAGVLAATARYALEHMVQRLPEDHAHARQLADGLMNCPGIHVDMDAVQTNIVNIVIQTGENSRSWLKRLEQEQNLRVHYIDPKTVRLVTYRGITSEDIEEAIQRLQIFTRGTY